MTSILISKHLQLPGGHFHWAVLQGASETSFTDQNSSSSGSCCPNLLHPLLFPAFLHPCIQSHNCQLSDPEVSNPPQIHLIFHFHCPKPHQHCFLSGFICLSVSFDPIPKSDHGRKKSKNRLTYRERVEYIWKK